jgi:hypothetical protein
MVLHGSLDRRSSRKPTPENPGHISASTNPGAVDEVWFGIIERQAIHRGSYRSVRDLTTEIRAFNDGWNDRRHPFTWTKTADQTLTKANVRRLRKRRTRVIRDASHRAVRSSAPDGAIRQSCRPAKSMCPSASIPRSTGTRSWPSSATAPPAGPW